VKRASAAMPARAMRISRSKPVLRRLARPFAKFAYAEAFVFRPEWKRA